jgi:hypothetical protein
LHGNAQFVRRMVEQPAYVDGRPEPQLLAVNQPGRQCLGNDQSGPAAVMGVESSLELACQIAVDQTAQELAVCVSQARVAGAAAPAALLSKLLADGHAPSLPGKRSTLAGSL